MATLHPFLSLPLCCSSGRDLRALYIGRAPDDGDLHEQLLGELKAVPAVGHVRSRTNRARAQAKYRMTFAVR